MRTARDETVRAVIHICVETTQGNFLCRYLYPKLTKMCFSFCLLCFFLLQNQRIGFAIEWEGEVAGTGIRGWIWYS
jgi:hypothetical protein